MDTETLDLVVIGAGIAGLATAKTHRQLWPDATLAVVEANTDAGGVWASDRLYPGLRTNNLVGTYEYPDFPMDPAEYGVRPGEHVPAAVMHRYLETYARAFGVWDHIRFRTKVVAAEHLDSPDGGWMLTMNGPDGVETSLMARKLVVATGTTSNAYLPRFPGQHEFGAPIFHTKHFLKHLDTLDPATTKRVTVLGGGKSSWDAVYQYATQGMHVDWIMRDSGKGPIWQAPPHVTPFRKQLEKLVNTRMLTWFSPCIWGPADGYARVRSFFHGTALGRAITNAFWWVLSNDVLGLNGYDRHPATVSLKPWSPAMFQGSSFSILNYPTDFFDLVRQGVVRVHVAGVARLGERAVVLPDGTVLPTDALCCGTGWSHAPSMRFLPEGIERELGIPYSVADGDDDDDDDARAVWRPEVVARADKDILTLFPRLRDQPVIGGSSTDHAKSSSPTPYSLYRFMAPPSERLMAVRDVAFAGVLMNFSVAPIAHAQALWINAYFAGALSSTVIPPPQPSSSSSSSSLSRWPPAEGRVKTMHQVRYEAVLFSRFGRWRYPAGHRGQIPDFVFDAVPYLDLLVRDLGLKVHRKKGWFAEITEPYGPGDYRSLVDEWVAKQKVW